MIARRVVIALVLGVLLFLVALAGIIGSGWRQKGFPVWSGWQRLVEKGGAGKEYLPPPRI